MIPFRHLEIGADPSEMLDGTTGVAWLSSARAVGCSLKWDNERNPYPMLQVSSETAPSQSVEAYER